MTSDQILQLLFVLTPCLALVLVAITITTWHYQHHAGIRENARALANDIREDEQTARDKAAQAERDKINSSTQAIRLNRQQEIDAEIRHKELEVEAAKEQSRSRRVYEEAMADIGTKYALYCPGCGKIMTLQHASRLPAELQAQMMYVPPANETTEKEDEEPRGERTKKRK